jgi:endonuclease III
MTISATALLDGLRGTLQRHLPKYESIIDEFGQVAACVRREKGEAFALKDHVAGLIKSLLSNQQDWGKIQSNMDRIYEIFDQFDPAKLKSADPKRLEASLRRIKCANRQISRQMGSLKQNIEVFEKIAVDFGSIDNFLQKTSIRAVVFEISSGKYKLQQVGPALAYEYLRHVGIRVAKPDTHVRRVLGSTRLALLDTPMPPEISVVGIIEELATTVSINPSYLDTLLWLFCAKSYAAICGSEPECIKCELSRYCAFPNQAG